MSLRNVAPSRWLLPLLTAAVVLGVWYGTIAVWRLEAFLLPAPHQILQAMIREQHLLIPAASRTFFAAIVGFSCAVVGGALTAMVLASSRVARRALSPYVLMLQMTPVVVLAPIFVIWFGEGLPSITAITFLIGFFPVAANTLAGLRSVDRGLVDLFHLAKATRRQELLKLRLPAALPHFLTGVKIAGTLAPIGAIAGDFLAGSADRYAGLGFLIGIFRAQVKVDAVFAVALLACLLGFLFVGAVSLLHWRLLHAWHESYPRRDS